MLILSIVTGDSKILSETLDAATTTSEPNTKLGLRFTVMFEKSVTLTSLLSKPTEEKTNVNGGFTETGKVKVPLSLV